MAILAADPLHRQSKQNVLAQNLFQLDSAPFIKGDLALSFVDGDFLVVFFLNRGAIEQIEVRLYRKLSRLQAAIALASHPDLYMPTDPNLSQSVREQFRRALGIERSRLLEPVTRKIDVAGREGHVEMDLL